MRRAAIVIGAAALVFAACDRFKTIEEPITTPSLDTELRQQLGNWGVIPIGDMPAVDSSLLRLGQALMFDKILSGNRDISCATCHDPTLNLTDGMSHAIGTGATVAGSRRILGAGRSFGARSAPTLINQGLRSYELFWDGRVSGFGSGPFNTPAGNALPAGLPDIAAAQAMFPVTSRQEMRGNAGDVDRFGSPNELARLGDTQYQLIWTAVMARLLAIPAYDSMFRAAFPTAVSGGFTFKHAATAIAAFEMTAYARTNSPFDRYLAHDNTALSADQKRGALLFFGKARCSQCHNGALIGGQGFANVGVPQIGPGSGAAAPLDLGRGGVNDTVFGGPFGPGGDFYRFAFRVPQLRNVELTAPYFHDGAYPTLEAVVHHYNDVPTALRSYDITQVDPSVRGMYHNDPATLADMIAHLDFRISTPLGLTEPEMKDVVAFLGSLTDPAARDFSAVVPTAVPSGLPIR